MSDERVEVRRQTRNANKHTERGMSALASSVEQDGTIGAITVAASFETFDGSARVEVIPDDYDDVIVHTDGRKRVIHVRDDIPDASDPRAVRLGIAANRVAQLNLAWDPAVMKSLEGTIDFSGMWARDEFAALFADPDVEVEHYSRKVQSPVYEPRGEQPAVAELYDTSTTVELVRAIDERDDLDDDLRGFLRAAAQRHVVFHYNRIADYYAHADAATQRLMEQSALVIIDFDRAIELGYVSLTRAIAAQYADEHGNGSNGGQADDDADDDELDDDDR